MNCKPGDLAYTVAPFVAEGRGFVVTIIRRARRFESFGEAHFTHENARCGAWVVAGAVRMEDGCIERMLVIADECLRPIRDPGDDAKDEMLRPLPHEVTV